MFELTEKCVGCKKIVEGRCSVYENPAAKMSIGGCYFAPKEEVVASKSTKIKRSVKSKVFAVSKYRRRRTGK